MDADTFSNLKYLAQRLPFREACVRSKVTVQVSGLYRFRADTFVYEYPDYTCSFSYCQIVASGRTQVFFRVNIMEVCVCDVPIIFVSCTNI